MATVQWEEYIHQNKGSHPLLPPWVSVPHQEAYSKSHYGECSWTGRQTGSSQGSLLQEGYTCCTEIQNSSPALFTLQCLFRAGAPPGLLNRPSWDRWPTWAGETGWGHGLAGSRVSQSVICLYNFLKGRRAPCTSWSLRFRWRTPWVSTVFLQRNNTR